MRTLVKELKEKVGQEVTLYLTLDVLRDQKHLQFILAHDKSGPIQLVVSKKTVEKHEEIGQLLQGSAFIAHGTVIEMAQSKTMGLELGVSSIEIISKAEAFPITQESSIDLRFDYRTVDLKFPRQQLLFRVRSAFIQGCREYLLSQSMTEVTSPRLLKSASESGSQVFSVKYFDKTAYLCQSPQLAKQACAMAFEEGIFEVGPIFRSESSFSSRHLCEFTGIDIEIAWLTLEEIMKLEEDMLCYAFKKLEPFREDVKRIFGVELITQPTVQYMTLDKAKKILKEKAGMELSKDQDLPDEGERKLFEILGKDLIFVTDYPIAKRPFYHAWEREKGTTKSYDLIMSGIEITSGSVREHSHEQVCKQALEKGVKLESIDEYLQTFKYGTPPTAGFGLGVERVIAKILGLASVKDASLFPKDPDRL
jgi:aspartyl-tRNA synthetase